MIHAVEFGSGEHVALGLHGWGGDHRTFIPISAYVPERWRLVALDLPGYGNSPSMEPFDLSKVVLSVVEFIKTLEQPVTIVGSCSGAVIALEIAQAVPAAVERIVAIDLFGYMPWYFRFFATEPIGKWAYAMTFDSSFGRKVINALLWFRRTPSSDLTASFVDKNAVVTRSYLRALAALPGPERYAGLKIPVALVWGERSFRAVHHSVEIWQRYLSYIELHCIEQAGHLLLDEAPHRVAPIVFWR